MEINKIKLGMELKSDKKKNIFICEKINEETGIVEDRMVRKDGQLGKRVLNDAASNILTAQTVLGGCERNGQK